MTREEIRSLVDSLGGLLSVLRRADPADKHQVYRELGLKLTYNDNTRMVIAEAIPSVCVKNVSGGGHIRYPQRSDSPVAADHASRIPFPNEQSGQTGCSRNGSGYTRDRHAAG